MTTSQEAFEIVCAINHPQIKMQLDTGEIKLNGGSITEILSYSKSKIGHIHISEPGLAVLGDGDVDHRSYAEAITANIDNPLISIEMAATENESHPASVERALAFVTENYRSL